MDRHDGKIVLNGAVSQYDRWLRALDPGYAPVDGRPLPQLLDFAVGLARLINFFDLGDEADGDWVGFFLTDPAMVLASIESVDLARVEADFSRLQRRTAAECFFEPKLALLRELFAEILGLARKVDRWLRVLNECTGEAAWLARQEIGALIASSLREPLRRLKSYDEGAGRPDALKQPIGLDYSGFLPVWDLGCVCPDGSIYRGATPVRKINHALPFLDPLFEDFVFGISDLQLFARASLPAALAEGDHKPQIALYLAFARLFETAQASVNTFSSRYQHFYYRDVLRERPRPAVPDSVYLAFTLAGEDGLRSAAVPRGTLFPAGQDRDGREILYAADRSLTVTAARLARILTLRVLRGPLYTEEPAGSPPPDVAVGVLASEIAVDQAVPSGWATFGAASPGITEAEATRPAALGFALASPYLLLTGGLREIVIEVHYAPAFQREILAPLLQELSGVTGLPPAAVFHRILLRAFTLHVSTAGGWFPLETYDVLGPISGVEAPDPHLTLGLRLPASVPPVVPLGPDAGGEVPNPAPSLPTLAAYLRQEPVELAGERGTVSVHPLSLLDGMEVTGFEIHTRVMGLADVTLENTDGEIDPGSPFPLFGALPVVGSYVQIRSPELFGKTPECVRAGVRWFNLPQNETGFKGWYRDYVIGPDGETVPSGLFDNQVFRGTFRVHRPGSWHLAGTSPPDAESVFLFRTRHDCEDPEPVADGRLCDASGFELVPVPREVPAYYAPGESALRLELTAPSYAFGNDLYAVNVLNAIIEDLPDTQACQEKCLAECSPPDEECIRRCMDRCLRPKKELKYPNEPYLPMAESVTLDYSASCALGGSPGDESCGLFFHLLPFGGYRSIEPGAAEETLLPRLPPPGNLYLGFSGLLPPQTLTLLFQMTAGSGGHEPGEPPPVAWEYLSGNRWERLRPPQVPSDSTRGLQSSGIVTLALPALDPAGHTVLPGDLQWLRASVSRGPGRFPRTIAVIPHASTATWQNDDGTGEHLAQPLPAGTIASSVQDLPGIETILQPMESFGGRPPETDRTFEIRLGERLRHKDRAILGWDYERLVLERFPTVWKVQALPARSPLRGCDPGHVLVVIVPGPDSLQAVDPTAPAAPADLLQRIQCYLEGLASPFVCLHVVNPIYVRIEVIARLSFSDPDDPGAGIDRLDAELTRYLSPWFYDAARAAKRGRYASEADISEFIQTRPYVDAVDSIDFCYEPEPEELDSDWYFLTSAHRHRISEADRAGDRKSCSGAW